MRRKFHVVIFSRQIYDKEIKKNNGNDYRMFPLKNSTQIRAIILDEALQEAELHKLSNDPKNPKKISFRWFK